MIQRIQTQGYILAFLKAITPDGQPQPLGQDEKNHLNQIISLISTKDDERELLFHLAIEADGNINQITINLDLMSKEVKGQLLIDIFAYLNTAGGLKRKRNIITSDFFRELKREFTSERISFLRKIGYRKYQEMEKEKEDKIDNEQNEETQAIENSSEKPEETPRPAADEKPDQDKDDPHRMKMKEGLHKAKKFAEKSEGVPRQATDEKSDQNQDNPHRMRMKEGLYKAKKFAEKPEEAPRSAADEKSDRDEDDPHRMEMKERLRKAKRFATGLLASMAAIFILHWIFSADYPGSGMVMAFAAAAMIGGLADWYAVTALFRNPLYIPEKVNLPHTAIIPKRKDEIGEELANFVKNKILVRDVVEEQLRDSELTRRMGEWLQDETNAKRVTRDFSEIIEWLRSTDSSELLGGFKRMITGKIAQRIPVNKALAAIIDVLTTGNNTQVMIDELTQFGIQQIDHNRDAILEFVRKIFKNEDGWLMRLLKKIGLGGMTDEKIGELYTKLEPEIKQKLNEIRNDPKHPIRIEFNNRLRSWHEKLMNDASTAKKCDHLLEEFLRNEAVRDFFQSLWDKTRDAIYAELKNESSDIRRSIEREIQNIGKKLSGDTNLRKSVDTWLGEWITNIVVRHSDQISKAISDTIKKWDAKTTAESIELQIGRDLQFIRINGTIVGGLIGIVIYLLTGFHH